MPLVNSTVALNMVSTLKKKQQNKRLPSQLNESDANFMIGQSNREAQAESGANAADRDTFLIITKDTNQVNGSQVDLHTLKRNIFSEV